MLAIKIVRKATGSTLRKCENCSHTQIGGDAIKRKQSNSRVKGEVCINQSLKGDTVLYNTSLVQHRKLTQGNHR